MADFKKLADIEDEAKYVVFGFIREHEHEFKSLEYNLFNNMPVLIPSLCILYYQCISDYFESLANKIRTSNNNRTNDLAPFHP